MEVGSAQRGADGHRTTGDADISLPLIDALADRDLVHTRLDLDRSCLYLLPVSGVKLGKLDHSGADAPPLTRRRHQLQSRLADGS